MSAGKLDYRAAFKSPIETKDAAGQTGPGFSDEFTLWAGIRHRTGGEGVLAARMQAKTLAIVKVRASSESRRIRANWILELTGHGYSAARFSVRENPRETGNYLEFLAETGVGT